MGAYRVCHDGAPNALFGLKMNEILLVLLKAKLAKVKNRKLGPILGPNRINTNIDLLNLSPIKPSVSELAQ